MSALDEDKIAELLETWSEGPEAEWRRRYGVARKVFFHIGLPKTGTTYLQTILWNNRDELRNQGVLLPGGGSRQHLWASAAVRGERRIRRRDPKAVHAWTDLTAEVNDWPGTALISHEFFCGASEAQASQAIMDLAGAEVHVVVTARDTVSLVTARWQEVVKNGSTREIDGYPATEKTDPRNEWDWGTMDLGDVLTRWSATLPPERVHVITVPKPDLPRETLWLRFAELVGVDPNPCDSSVTNPNESLGVVEVELLRRINAHLGGFMTPANRGVWIRGYLAQEKLVPRGGERFWPSAERIELLRARGDAAVDLIKRQGFDVIGDVDDLLTPQELPQRRHPSSVTDTEMLDAATSTIAEMLSDVGRLTHEASSARPVAAVTPPMGERVAGRLRREWTRVKGRLGRP